MYNEATPWLGQVAWLIQQGEPVARKDLVDLKLIYGAKTYDEGVIFRVADEETLPS